MSEKHPAKTAEDRYLDLMIRLALERREERETERLLNDPEYATSQEDLSKADQAFRTAMERAEVETRTKKKSRAQKKLRKVLLAIGKAAACLIIIAGITVPVALAISSDFRSCVMQLLMELDEQNQEARFSFAENESAAFTVPEVWPGDWYPSWIPEDLALINIDQDIFTAAFSDGSTRQLWFLEMNEDSSSIIGTEEAALTSVAVNGANGWLIEGNDEFHSITLVWSADDKWFELNAYMLTKDEVISVAESVRRIYHHK